MLNFSCYKAEFLKGKIHQHKHKYIHIEICVMCLTILMLICLVMLQFHYSHETLAVVCFAHITGKHCYCRYSVNRRNSFKKLGHT